VRSSCLHTGHEVVAFLHCPRLSVMTIVIYRPVLAAACNDFFDDLADLLKCLSSTLICWSSVTSTCISSNTHTIKFQQLLEAHDLTQHIVGATHSLSHTLHVLITHAEQTVNSVSVNPPALSDHSQIVGVLAAWLPHPHTGTRQVGRCWWQLDLEELKHDI